MDITDPSEDAASCEGGVKIPVAVEEASQPPIFPTLPPLSESLRDIEPSEETVCAWKPCAEDKLYTFLSHCARANITQVCKELAVPRWGGKDAMVGRLYAHLLRKTTSGGLITESDIENLRLEMARTKKGRTLSEFLSDQEDTSNIFFIPWSRAPAIVADDRDEVATDQRAANTVLRPESCSRSREEPRVREATERTTKAPNIGVTDAELRVQAASLPEFARLIAILVFDEEVRNALVESALERTRQQLDTRSLRDEFWDTIVASKFNDADFQTRDQGISRPIGVQYIPDTIAEIEICMTPQHYRSGQELKRWYWDTRSAFTIAHDRWSRSGQNDPDSFHKFVPTTSNGMIAAAGKRLLIMFHAMKVGTDYEVSDLLSFTLRTVPEGIGFDSMASRAESLTGPDCGEELTPRTNMKSDRKRRKLSRSEEYVSREVIASSEDLHASISSALAQLKPDKQHHVAEKAERSFKLFTALKAAREFRQTCEGAPEAEQVADQEIKRLLRDLSSIGDEE